MFARIVMDVIAGWLDGYKTYLAGVGMMLGGVAGIIGYYWPDSGVPLQYEPSKAFDMIAVGLMAIGFGRKLDKAAGIEQRGKDAIRR